MNRGLNVGLLVFGLAGCLAGRADYQSGFDAYLAGDFDQARQEWMAAVDAPPDGVTPRVQSETFYGLAMLYWRGEGVAKDYHQARTWLEQAAALGHSGAMGKLGFLYTDGLTVPRDHDEAFRWFSEAARLGDVDAQYNLGIFYLNGWGTPPDRTMAKQYLAAASANGDPAAEDALQQLLAEEDRQAARAADEWVAAPEPQSPEPALLLGEAWIAGQPANEYTIQVIALSSREKVDRLVEGHKALSPWAMYTVQSSSKPLYVLVQGRYANVEAARKAKETIPPEVQKPDQLWIRKFGKVQELIAMEQEG